MTKKLDKEHLEAIRALHSQFNQNAATLGALAIDERMIQSQQKQLDQVRTEHLEQFDRLREEETKLMETLKERYGEGEINIQDGTFTPALTSMSAE
jgi:hypothetical protein